MKQQLKQLPLASLFSGKCCAQLITSAIALILTYYHFFVESLLCTVAQSVAILYVLYIPWHCGHSPRLFGYRIMVSSECINSPTYKCPCHHFCSCGTKSFFHTFFCILFQIKQQNYAFISFIAFCICLPNHPLGHTTLHQSPLKDLLNIA